jgi:hypothetical protein
VNARHAIILLALLVAARAGPAAAGLLVEGRLQGVPIRLEVGRDPDLVRIRLAGSDRLIDLGREQIFQPGHPGRMVDAGKLPDPTSTSRYDLTYWGGKRLTIAGEKGGYFVMTLQERTCGEAVVATWTRPLIGSLVAAVELLQRSEAGIRPIARKACGTIPFHAYALAGWPLLAGWVDARVFETSRIDMAYQPDESLFLRP